MNYDMNNKVNLKNIKNNYVLKEDNKITSLRSMDKDLIKRMKQIGGEM